MDATELDILENGSAIEAQVIAKKFAEKNNQTFSFYEMHEDGRLRRLWSALFRRLSSDNDVNCIKYCLICVRILSRDKDGLNDLINDERLETLLNIAGLVSQEETLSKTIQHAPNYDVMIEALKGLCNIVYNSTQAQAICCHNHAVKGVIIRMRTYPDGTWPILLKYFDMKLLFLITALCASVRPELRGPLHGYTYLVESLDLVLKETSGEALSDEQVQFVCEILKVLFNLSIGGNQNDDEPHYMRLVYILQQLLLCRTRNKSGDLHLHVMNLLMTLPGSCYSELMTPADKGICPAELECEGYNMEAVAIMLGFLDEKLADQDAKQRPESLCAILTVLAKGARYQRPMRKFLRARILPPLGDQVLSRPEEGDSLRNRLCRLLTASNSIAGATDLAADFLFVLCKENVARMIKYTGYGNAAGLFANRGLLLGGDGKKLDGYSSDSDSDTEEYRKYKDSINPVTGCYEPPKPDPTAGMTEEQKEYEAMQLVNMMDRLSRDGVVQPCRIGDHGRPEPVEHVLQLLEDLPKQQIQHRKTNDA